jgi:hypothetical protein
MVIPYWAPTLGCFLWHRPQHAILMPLSVKCVNAFDGPMENQGTKVLIYSSHPILKGKFVMK